MGLIMLLLSPAVRSLTIIVALTILLLGSSGMSFAQDVDGNNESQREVGVLDCTDFQEIQCGWVVVGDNTSSPNNVETYGCNNWVESGGEQVWNLVLSEPREVSIILETPIACDLDLFLLSACDVDSCIEANSVVINRTLDSGEYFIVVDGFNGSGCEYQLSVSCENVATGAWKSETGMSLARSGHASEAVTCPHI
jgi:hypothetical protein